MYYNIHSYTTTLKGVLTLSSSSIHFCIHLLLPLSCFHFSSLVSAVESTNIQFTTPNIIVAEDNGASPVNNGEAGSCDSSGMVGGTTVATPAGNGSAAINYTIQSCCYADIDAASASMIMTEEEDGDISLSNLTYAISGTANGPTSNISFSYDTIETNVDNAELYNALTHPETLGDLENKTLILSTMTIGDTTQGDTLTTLVPTVMTVNSYNFSWNIQFVQQDPVLNIKAAHGASADVIFIATIDCDNTQ